MNREDADRQKKNRMGSFVRMMFHVFFALCAAFALVLDLNVRSGNNYVNWAESLPGMPVVTVLFSVLLFLMHKTDKELPRTGWGTWILAFFLGFCWVLAVSVRNTQDVNQPFLSSSQLLKTGVMTAGMAGLYQLFFRGLVFALGDGAAWKPSMQDGHKLIYRLAEGYKRHTFWFCTLLILLAWLPHFAISYPCAMNGDSVTQLREWTGIFQFSSHHPPFGTLLIGLFYEAGLKLGDGALGLALYIAVQMMLSAAVLGYMQSVMRHLCAPLWLRGLALFTACVCPVYADNITAIIKDVPYAYGMLLVLCEITKSLFIQEKPTAAGMLRLLLGGMFVMLMRNNGKFVLLPMAVCMIVWAARKPKVRAAAACALAASIALSMGVDAWLVSTYDIVPGSRREALSLPFQQTARFVRDHEQEIPQDEQDAIEAVLGMSGLGKSYDPMISDPVKGRYRSEVTNQDLMRYFSVWFKQFFRDPLCYIKATLIQNSLLFDPQTINLAIFDGTGLDTGTKERLNITETDARNGLRSAEGHLRTMFLSLPCIAQLNSLGFHCCVLLFVCLWAAKGKHGTLLICLLPMVISMLVIVAGPCIQNQDRYGFPIVYCMPLVLACMSYALRNKKKCCEVNL